MKKKVKKAVSAMSILGAVVVLGISASLIDNPKWVVIMTIKNSVTMTTCTVKMTARQR